MAQYSNLRNIAVRREVSINLNGFYWKTRKYRPNRMAVLYNPTLKRLKQEDYNEFKPNLGYTMRFYLKKENEKNKQIKGKSLKSMA